MKNLNPLFEAPQTFLQVVQGTGKKVGQMIPTNSGKVSSKGLRKLAATRQAHKYISGSNGSWFTPEQVSKMNSQEAIKRRLDPKSFSTFRV